MPKGAFAPETELDIRIPLIRTQKDRTGRRSLYAQAMAHAQELAQRLQASAAKTEEDPKAAAALLSDKEALLSLKKEPGRLAQDFLRAYALEDLRETIELHKDAGALRNALILRMKYGSVTESIGPGADVQAMRAWVARRLPSRLTLVQEALLEWEALLPGQRAWLEGKGRTQSSWKSVRLDARKDLLFPWAAKTARGLLAAPLPADDASVKRLAAEAESVFYFLSEPDQVELMRRVDRAQAALRAPRIQAPVPLPAPRPEDALTEEERARLSASLKPLLLDALQGSSSAEEVLRFYGKGAVLSLSVQSMPGMNALFRPSTQDIALSAEYAQDWLFERGKSARDLFADPLLLSALARGLAPFFLHESVHYLQYVWRKDAKLLQVFTQEDEIEAYSAEASYVLEQRRASGSDEDFDIDNRQAADRLEEDPAHFARIIRRIYTDLPSHAFFSAGLLKIVVKLSAELARRASLDASARAQTEHSTWDPSWRWALEHGGDISLDIPSASEKSLLFWQDELIRWITESASHFERSFKRTMAKA
jgi:hypothetical protein